jgi:hypothetical protein
MIMDIQSIKLHFIQDFLKLENEQSITNLVEALNHEKKELYSQKLEAMKMETFNKMIDQAEDDANHGRTKDAKTLRKEIESWK